MATFYVLPPRSVLEDQVAGLLSRLLPGLPAPVDAWDVLVENFAAAAGWPEDAYLVPRDDLPFGASVEDALADCFGAEPGDRIIEVRGAPSKLQLA